MSNRAFGFHNADLVGAPWYVASTKYVAKLYFEIPICKQ